MLPLLAAALCLGQAPATQQGGLSAQNQPDRAAVLKNFDFSFTAYNSTGTFFGAEGYSNSFTFWLEPSWSFGRTFFNGTWFDALALSVRLPIEVQLVGNDPRFSGTRFSSASLYNPEALPIIETQSGGAGGPQARPVILGDTWLTLSHGHLLTIPLLGIDVSSSLRTALPTSVASRNEGLIASLGLGLIFERKFFERLSLGYAVRSTKYFYSRTQGGIAPLGAPVVINGNPEPTWTPSSTGVANADFGFLNGWWATLELPAGFGVSLNYFLFHTKPYAVTGGCNPLGIEGVDVCADGKAVGPVTDNPWRNEHWFLVAADYHHSFWGLSLGLSTFRSIENPDRTTSQPVFVSNRHNYTTVYLSFSSTAEGIAAYVTGTQEKKP